MKNIIFILYFIFVILTVLKYKNLINIIYNLFFILIWFAVTNILPEKISIFDVQKTSFVLLFIIESYIIYNLALK